MLLGILVNSSQTYGSFEKQRELPVFQKEQIEKKRQFCASCYAKYFLTSAVLMGLVCLPNPKKIRLKGFRPPSAMQGIGYFQNQELFQKLFGNFLDLSGIFLGNFLDFSWILYYFWRDFLRGIFWEDFLGGFFFEDFFGRIFWEDFQEDVNGM